ncbi:MAG TPA: ribonuclease HII [Myxococcota bacterium]|nr:ribonuclease HII [Myxococcota bacterium]
MASPGDEFFGQRVLGIDEAGRGPLAGPVVAAGVMLDQRHHIIGLKDSKKLTKLAREDLYEEIMERALFVSVKAVDNRTIDRINILQATLLAMKEVILAFNPKEAMDAVLIDGNQTVSGISHFKQYALVNGDNRHPNIMAASIIAKVRRDQLMMSCHEQFPDYGFDSHKGYGTELHLQAIARLGPCPIHRLSFAPFKDTE